MRVLQNISNKKG